jgi:transglutaminase-like putative cysteine protease
MKKNKLLIPLLAIVILFSIRISVFGATEKEKSYPVVTSSISIVGNADKPDVLTITGAADGDVINIYSATATATDNKPLVKGNATGEVKLNKVDITSAGIQVSITRKNCLESNKLLIKGSKLNFTKAAVSTDVTTSFVTKNVALISGLATKDVINVYSAYPTGYSLKYPSTEQKNVLKGLLIGSKTVATKCSYALVVFKNNYTLSDSSTVYITKKSSGKLVTMISSKLGEETTKELEPEPEVDPEPTTGSAITMNAAKDTIKQVLEKFDTDLILSIKDYDGSYTIKQLSDSVISQNPDINYGYTGFSYWKNTVPDKDGNTIFNITFKYNLSKAVMLQQKEAVKDAAKTIIATIVKDDMTPYQKQLAIHKYVVANAKYDTSIPNEPSEAHNAYGILVKKVGVCDGYAKAMFELLTLAGIETKFVEGAANNGTKSEGHAWNLVKLDEEWYHLDATWDDPIPDRGSVISYTYFNVTDDFIAKNHTWERSKYPTCTSIKQAYK